MRCGFTIIAGTVWGVGIGTSFSAMLAVAANGQLFYSSKSLRSPSPTLRTPPANACAA